MAPIYSCLLWAGVCFSGRFESMLVQELLLTTRWRPGGSNISRCPLKAMANWGETVHRRCLKHLLSSLHEHMAANFQELICERTGIVSARNDCKSNDPFNTVKMYIFVPQVTNNEHVAHPLDLMLVYNKRTVSSKVKQRFSLNCLVLHYKCVLSHQRHTILFLLNIIISWWGILVFSE